LIGARAAGPGPRIGSRVVAGAWVWALAITSAVASDEPPPRAVTPDTWLHELVRDVRARIDTAIVARPPVLVPPKKIAVRWKLVKLGSLDLGAPLVALAGADLDGDGRGELYAVTAHEVIAIGMRGKKLEELGRVAFSGEAALPMPRDVVGHAIVDPAVGARPGSLDPRQSALVASVSTWARSLRVTLKGGVLAGAPGELGFALCPGERAQLAPGRNYFGDATTGYYGVRCTSGLVEPDGRPIRTRAQLSLAHRLEVQVERCVAANLGCQPAGKHEYAGVGVAFEIADVDRDGRPEAIFAGAGAPGDPDVLKVVTLGDDDKKRAKVKKTFAAGGVAGIAVADLAGDGTAEVVAAVRILGATRVDLWRLE
jgi:hypothetical protein